MVTSDTLEIIALSWYEITCKDRVYDKNENCQLEVRLKSVNESPNAAFRRVPANEREQLTNRLEILRVFRDLAEFISNLFAEM